METRHLRVRAVSAHMDLGAPGAAERLARRIGFAAEIGARYLITNAGPARSRDAISRRIVDATAHLERAGVVLALENPGHGHRDLLPRCGRPGRHSLDAIDADPAWVGLNLDLGNVLTYKGSVDPVAEIAAAGPRLVHLHCKDVAERDGDWVFVPIGEGDVDYLGAAGRAAGRSAAQPRDAAASSPTGPRPIRCAPRSRCLAARSRRPFVVPRPSSTKPHADEMRGRSRPHETNFSRHREVGDRAHVRPTAPNPSKTRTVASASGRASMVRPPERITAAGGGDRQLDLGPGERRQPCEGDAERRRSAWPLHAERSSRRAEADGLGPRPRCQGERDHRIGRREGRRLPRIEARHGDARSGRVVGERGSVGVRAHADRDEAEAIAARAGDPHAVGEDVRRSPPGSRRRRHRRRRER